MDKRISYYTKKVAQYGRQPRRNKYRYERLMQYKQRLNELATAE